MFYYKIKGSIILARISSSLSKSFNGKSINRIQYKY
jgi:hypothetical protein